MAKNTSFDLEKLVVLLKKRGFVFPSSEIYGGLSAAYDYGPLGVEMMLNIKQSWWDFFVRRRSDVFGLDTAIFMNPKVWEASGHTQHFTDPLVECKSCHKRSRPDKIVEEVLRKQGRALSEVNMKDHASLQKAMKSFDVVCPECGEKNFTEIRDFNTLFETYQGVVKESEDCIYLRGEIAQGMFVNFKNVVQSMRPQLPFGLAQQGKAFRNEVTVKRFLFRTREFNLMEIEYFVSPSAAAESFEMWKQLIWEWYTKHLGMNESSLHWREQSETERAHYSSGTFDLEYKFPWDWDEVGAVANRTDFDLKNHQEKSGVDLTVPDPLSKKNVLPYVIEPTFGIDRAFLAVFMDALEVVPGGRSGESKQEEELVLHLKSSLAPVQVAVLPLSKKQELIIPAQQVATDLNKHFRVEFDVTQSIGKRYRRQDEIGTPYCVTFDFDSLKDHQVTVRDRDTMKQNRIAMSSLVDYLKEKF